MRRALPSLILVSALAVTLGGCDSIDEVPLEQLAGEWTSVEHDAELYIVPSVDGSYPDFSRPGEGAITLSGAVEAELRYTRPFEEIPGGGRGTAIAFADEPFGPEAAPSLLLDFYSRRDSRVVLTARAADGQVREFSWSTTGFMPWPPTPEPEGGRVTLDEPRTLTGDDGSTVTVTGGLTFATRRVAAGDTVFFSPTDVYPWTTRYDISGDGTVVRTLDCGDDPPIEGTIEGTGERGTFSFEPPPTLQCPEVPSVVHYRVEGDALVLSFELERPAHRVFSLRQFQESYGVAPPDPVIRVTQRLERTGGP